MQFYWQLFEEKNSFALFYISSHVIQFQLLELDDDEDEDD